MKDSELRKELRKELETWMVDVSMSYAEVLILHAVGVLMDGRSSMGKLLRKRISPVAESLLKEHPEYK